MTHLTVGFKEVRRTMFVQFVIHSSIHIRVNVTLKIMEIILKFC